MIRFLARTASIRFTRSRNGCPHCGNYISDEDTPPARKPWWIIIGVLLVFYIIYRWIAG